MDPVYAFKQNNEKASPRQQRQLQYISQFSTDIRHISGDPIIPASREDPIIPANRESPIGPSSKPQPAKPKKCQGKVCSRVTRTDGLSRSDGSSTPGVCQGRRCGG
ncbi:hypothetical protein LAZ67_12001295 [Cordylochernes scorpioides]|uniref:Uncharacterized protein n=1 Tax=Cordylochernes scorpioides TaxID=51811 RepID=A0ABY6L127_9ARAC|nr:hypothetical protein LAZ67_12001295 [Cordylochernes scorpioides]